MLSVYGVSMEREKVGVCTQKRQTYRAHNQYPFQGSSRGRNRQLRDEMGGVSRGGIVKVIHFQTPLDYSSWIAKMMCHFNPCPSFSSSSSFRTCSRSCHPKNGCDWKGMERDQNVYGVKHVGDLPKSKAAKSTDLHCCWYKVLPAWLSENHDKGSRSVDRNPTGSRIKKEGGMTSMLTLKGSFLLI